MLRTALTLATRCVELGFDVKCLSELLGHSTVTMPMEHKREHMQRLSDFMQVW